MHDGSPWHHRGPHNRWVGRFDPSGTSGIMAGEYCSGIKFIRIFRQYVHKFLRRHSILVHDRLSGTRQRGMC